MWNVLERRGDHAAARAARRRRTGRASNGAAGRSRARRCAARRRAGALRFARVRGHRPAFIEHADDRRNARIVAVVIPRRQFLALVDREVRGCGRATADRSDSTNGASTRPQLEKRAELGVVDRVEVGCSRRGKCTDRQASVPCRGRRRRQPSCDRRGRGASMPSRISPSARSSSDAAAINSGRIGSVARAPRGRRC